VVVPDGADQARRPPLPVERPDALAVEVDLVGVPSGGLEPRDVHQAEVVPVERERPVAAAEDLDLARTVGLDPHRRVVRADVAQERPEQKTRHGGCSRGP
jgi:hypothetical protein